jgi:hypothetical protein
VNLLLTCGDRGELAAARVVRDGVLMAVAAPVPPALWAVRVIVYAPRRGG